MPNMQQQRARALIHLQAARNALQAVDNELAAATLILEEDGAYDTHGVGDVCGVVRDAIDELESLVQQYVN